MSEDKAPPTTKMTQIFKVGDRVSWLGFKGRVDQVNDFVWVAWDCNGASGFFLNGAYLLGQRPSLKLLKKSPRYVKRVGYQAIRRATDAPWSGDFIYKTQQEALVDGVLVIGFRKVVWWEVVK